MSRASAAICPRGWPRSPRRWPEAPRRHAQGRARAPQPTRHVIQDGRKAAMISFDMTADGFRAVPRPHLSVIAGGLAISLEADIPQGATIMSAFAPGSFAGLSAALVTWLLSAGTLVLHHPFDEELLTREIVTPRCDTLIAPAQLALRLDELDLVTRLPGLRNIVGLWRAPEQVASSPSWTEQHVAMTDVYLFGEAGLFSARGGEGGAPGPVKPGPQGARRETPGISIAGEILLTPKGTLALRGPMVSVAA